MISQDVLKSFQVTQEGIRLSGGQGEAWKYGNIVLKPINNEVYYSFVANIWNQLQPVGYRISRPIKSINNRYVEKGYAATRYEIGQEDNNAIKKKLAVSENLHRDLKLVGINKLPYSDDPWTKANNILWREDSLPDHINKKSLELCSKLLNSLDKIEAEYQLIHSDLGGNILFDEKLEPLVIDFSPTIAPKKFADAVIVCDSIAWCGVKMEAINYLQPYNNYIPFIQRAIVFRVITMALLYENSYEKVNQEWKAYKKIWDYVK